MGSGWGLVAERSLCNVCRNRVSLISRSNPGHHFVLSRISPNLFSFDFLSQSPQPDMFAKSKPPFPEPWGCVNDWRLLKILPIYLPEPETNVSRHWSIGTNGDMIDQSCFVEQIRRGRLTDSWLRIYFEDKHLRLAGNKQMSVAAANCTSHTLSALTHCLRGRQEEEEGVGGRSNRLQVRSLETVGLFPCLAGRCTFERHQLETFKRIGIQRNLWLAGMFTICFICHTVVCWKYWNIHSETLKKI